MCEEQNKVENNSADIFKADKFKEKIIKTISSHPMAVTASVCGIFVIGNAVITKHCIASGIYECNKKTINYISNVRKY